MSTSSAKLLFPYVTGATHHYSQVEVTPNTGTSSSLVVVVVVVVILVVLLLVVVLVTAVVVILCLFKIPRSSVRIAVPLVLGQWRRWTVQWHREGPP